MTTDDGLLLLWPFGFFWGGDLVRLASNPKVFGMILPHIFFCLKTTFIVNGKVFLEYFSAVSMSNPVKIQN